MHNSAETQAQALAPRQTGLQRQQSFPMASNGDSPLDLLWKEYSLVFRDFDDLTLGRWLAQTLGQIEGKAWRLSHPLLGACRMAAQVAHERQIWSKRPATRPPPYPGSPCACPPLL